MVGPRRSHSRGRSRSGSRGSGGGSGYYSTQIRREPKLTVVKHRGIRAFIQKHGSGYKATFTDPQGVDDITVMAKTRDEAIVKTQGAIEAVRDKQKKDYNKRHDVRKTNLRYKSKAVPLKELQNREALKWKEMREMEQKAGRERWSSEKQYSERVKIAKKWQPILAKPDLKPIIYRTSIGHYGGQFVEVPEEHFQEFKSYFPPKEFPREVQTTDVREKSTFEGEQRFRNRFPNSNKIKQVYFRDRSKGLKRLDFMELPRNE